MEEVVVIGYGIFKKLVYVGFVFIVKVDKMKDILVVLFKDLL